MEELLKLVELVKQEAPQARVKVDSLMVTHYFTMEELLNICNKYAEYKCGLADVSESAVRDALSKILKVGASMLTTGISGEISEWDLPKTTPKKTKRKIVEEADKWNEINRSRAIELKSAYDVLSKYFR